MKKKFFFLLAILFSTILCLVSKNNRVNAVESTNDLQDVLYSDTIMDMKEIMVNQKLYTAVLSADSIYIINHKGEVVNTIDYKFKDSLEPFLPVHYAFEVISDIDHKGTADFLISYKNQTVYTISYENHTILWEFTPKIKSVYTCNTLHYCKEDTGISHYEINQDLYLSAGYSLYRLNLKTGKVKNEYQYDNNIWDFTFIHDLNQNSSNDIALSVQTGSLIYLDGKTFSKIREGNDLSDDVKLEFTDFYIRPNITNIEFLDDRNVLVATSENGFVYEINVTNDEILMSTQLFTINASDYERLLSRKENEYEKIRDDHKEIYSFRPSEQLPKTNIYITSSFDSNELKDYVIEFNPDLYDFDYYSYVKCSQDNGCKYQEEDLNKSFIGINDSLVLYDSGIFQVANLKTNQIIFKYPPIDIPEHVDPNDITIHARMFLLKNSLFVHSGNRILYKYDLNDLENPLWKISTVTEKSIRRIDEYTIRFYGDEIYAKTGFSILNNEMDVIYSYNNSNETIMNEFDIIDDKLYFLARNKENNLIIHVVDLENGVEILKNDYQRIQNKMFSTNKISSNDLPINTKYYADINKDGIRELVVTVIYLNENVELAKQELYIYDMKNDVVLGKDAIEIPLKAQSFVYDDINQDELPELVVYDSNDKTLSMDIYETNNVYVMDNEIDHHYDFTIDTTLHEVLPPIDLNNDGFSEIIFDYQGSVKDSNNALFIFDYTEEKMIKYSHPTGGNYLFVSAHEDLDHDGKKEIVILDSKYSYSYDLVTIPYQYKILSYDNGELSTKFEMEMNVSKLISKKDIPTLVNYKDTNDDGVDDIIVSAYDTESNLGFEVYDYHSNTWITSYYYNLDNKISGINPTMNTKYYQSFTIKTIDNIDYAVTRVKGKLQNLYLYYDLTNYELKYLVDSTCIGQLGDEFLFYQQDMGPFITSKPISNDLIYTKRNKNDYNLRVDQQIKVKSIEVITTDGKFFNVTNNSIHMQLPNGKYQLLFKITTMDGGVYYYYDVVNVPEHVNSSVWKITILSIVLMGTLIGVRYVINRKFRIREGE